MAKRWSMNNYSSCCRCCRKVFPLPQINFGIKNWLRRYKSFSLYSNFSNLVYSPVLWTKFILVPPACTPRFPLEEEKEDVTDFKLSIILFSAPNAAARRSVAYIMYVLGCKISPQYILSDIKLHKSFSNYFYCRQKMNSPREILCREIGKFTYKIVAHQDVLIISC